MFLNKTSISIIQQFKHIKPLMFIFFSLFVAQRSELKSDYYYYYRCVWHNRAFRAVLSGRIKKKIRSSSSLCCCGLARCISAKTRNLFLLHFLYCSKLKLFLCSLSKNQDPLVVDAKSGVCPQCSSALQCCRGYRLSVISFLLSSRMSHC